MPSRRALIIRAVESRIHVVRGHKVLLDRDLAALYGASTGALNQAVGRNAKRFPPDFAFRLTAREERALISQSVISKGKGGRRHRARVFTEQGVAMLSSVLRSPRAIAVNVAIMRAFVRLRELLLTHEDLARRLAGLEKKYDGQFAGVFRAIEQLMGLRAHIDAPKHRIGFTIAGPAAPEAERAPPRLRDAAARGRVAAVATLRPARALEGVRGKAHHARRTGRDARGE